MVAVGEDPTGVYLTVLVLGVALTFLVGQVLMRAGQGFLNDVFDDPTAARSVNRLVTLLFHLVVLGLVALITTVDFPTDGVFETVLTKIGVILLVNGAGHGLTLLVLGRIRARRREQEIVDEMAAQVEQSRQFRGGPAPYNQTVGSPRAHTPRPVIESGPNQ